MSFKPPLIICRGLYGWIGYCCIGDLRGTVVLGWRSLVFYVIFAMDGWMVCEVIGETFPLQLFPLDSQSLEGAREREVFMFNIVSSRVD